MGLYVVKVELVLWTGETEGTVRVRLALWTGETEGTIEVRLETEVGA